MFDMVALTIAPDEISVLLDLVNRRFSETTLEDYEIFDGPRSIVDTLTKVRYNLLLAQDSLLITPKEPTNE